uniref:Uncharacterized protein n=1 Tax=Setaria digitata TaxID=48799 RepID=A0A915PRM6_9BILA
MSQQTEREALREGGIEWNTCGSCASPAHRESSRERNRWLPSHREAPGIDGTARQSRDWHSVVRERNAYFVMNERRSVKVAWVLGDPGGVHQGSTIL